MATEAHKFQVGVFVIAATVIGIGIVIWLGASRFFEKTQHFVTYFGESVQGLDTGAPVKYRGVPGGRVDAITIAPDGELIEVRLNIGVDAANALKRDPSLRATLELSGITGLRYIEIDRHLGEALNQAPILTFEPPYEVIPSARSSFKAIQAALSDVYDRIMSVDFPGISNDARSALQAANQLLRDERIDAMLTDLKATAQSTNELAKNLQAMTAGVKLAPVVANATQATAQAKELFTDLTKGMTGKQLADAITQLDALVRSTQQAITGIQYTLQKLDRTATSMQRAAEDVRSQPSRLLFGAPPAPRMMPEGTAP